MLIASTALAVILSTGAADVTETTAETITLEAAEAAVIAQPAPAPSGPRPPAFRPYNYDEDWSYLRDPSLRTTPWARMKAIPIGSEGWLSLGGEARWRAEHRGNERFGRGLQDDDGLFQQRIRLWADFNLNTSVRAFVDIQDARSWGLDSGEPFTEESRADFHQAFVEVRGEVGDARVRARVGRQEFGIGAFRIFEPREGANARTALDMARLIIDRPNGWSGGLFAGYAIRESKASFDDSTNYDYSLFGATASRRLGEGETAPRLELLYANTDRLGVAFDTGTPGQDDRHTFSARVFGRAEAWDYDVEGVYQGGDFRGLDISAWYVSGTVGRTFQHPWAPRVAVRVDAASGDDDRTDGELNTYNQLYVPPISLRTDFGVSNLVTVQPQVTFRPVPSTTVGLLTAGLWRQSTEDGVYALNGVPIRSGVEGDSAYVGWRYAAFASHVINPHVTLTGVVNYTTAGDFLEESGAEDQSYLGLILGVRF